MTNPYEGNGLMTIVGAKEVESLLSQVLNQLGALHENVSLLREETSKRLDAIEQRLPNSE
ncbi:hypothetical protein [Streptomyces sp. AcH 505]|uniref:hypothetical protein n=1 Tax=Streptomyces sp. AcH 505 TaxID=352211 RepID=UPI0012FECB01